MSGLAPRMVLTMNDQAKAGHEVPTTALLGLDRCAVTDQHGKHCPDRPTHKVEHDGKIVFLCDRCHLNWLSGTYGKPNKENRGVCHGKVL